MADFHNKLTDQFIEVILKLETKEDLYNFFDDVCTIKELIDMSQRFETAILLDKGVNYDNITKKLGVSAATISRVSRCLNYGNGGYKKAIENMKKED